MPTPPEERNWLVRDRQVPFGGRTLVMGVVNATPDSFYDGGQHASTTGAVDHALRLVEEGADILDIGGESSRPGSLPVSEDEEIRRIIPVIEQLASRTSTLLSVDTTKAQVARRALEAGAHIVNDISAARFDTAMLDVVREFRAGLVLMHMQGEPRTMQDNPVYADVVAEVATFLDERTDEALRHGVSRLSIAWDPGFGFGKTFDHNWILLAGLADFAKENVPLVVGCSRKRFLGELCRRDVGERLPASLAALTAAVLGGADIIRVHDVKESCDAARVVDRIKAERRVKSLCAP